VEHVAETSQVEGSVLGAAAPNCQRTKQENDLDVLEVGPGTNASSVPDSNDKSNIALKYVHNMTSWKMVRCFVPALRRRMGVRGIDPLFLNFGTR
jgi:hypothetical protein